MPSQPRQAFAQSYAEQYGLNQSETQSLASIAQQFSSAAATAKARSLSIIGATTGGALSSAAQQSVNQIGAAFDLQLLSLGSQFLASVRPDVATRIQDTIAGKH